MIDIQSKGGWFLTGLVACAAAALTSGAAHAYDLMRWRHAPAYPYAGRDPSSPWAHGSPVTYRSVTHDLQSYRPVEPLPWGDVNKGVTPVPKPPAKSE